jgi:hypothetical protein
MAHGGARPGAGRPKGLKTLREHRKLIPADIRSAARAEKMSPLEYMLAVMNDETADDARRDRMAQAAAPFVHPRAEAAKPSARDQVEETARTADRGTSWSALLQ